MLSEDYSAFDDLFDKALQQLEEKHSSVGIGCLFARSIYLNMNHHC